MSDSTYIERSNTFDIFFVFPDDYSIHIDNELKLKSYGWYDFGDFKSKIKY
jgi:hypothetical protein